MKTYLLLADIAELPVPDSQLPFDCQVRIIGIGKDRAVANTNQLLDELQESKELCRIFLFGTCGSLKYGPGAILFDVNWGPESKVHRIRTVESLVTPTSHDTLKFVERYDGYDMEMHYVMSAIKERNLPNVLDYFCVKVVSDATVASYEDWKQKVSEIEGPLTWALFTYLNRNITPKFRAKSYTGFPKKGICFIDLFPSFSVGVSHFTGWFASTVSTVSALVPIESRGFVLAGAILGRGMSFGVVPVRREGKLPGPTVKFGAPSEYGTRTLEYSKDHLRHLRPNGGILELIIVDDVLATGGTAKAVFQAINNKWIPSGGPESIKINTKVVGFCFYAEIKSLGGRKEIEKLAPVYSFIKF